MDGTALETFYYKIIDFCQNDIETKNLTENQYQKITSIETSLTTAIRKIDNIKFKNNGAEFAKFNNGLNAVNLSLLADIKEYERICEIIITAGIGVEILEDFVKIGTKLASYAA